ncbi:MAG: hypothetical protein R3Y56_10335, partial [Akkermansia sp.]
MKLHLPKSLRSALLACLAAVAPIATTVATSSMVAGTLTYTALAPQAEAANTDYWVSRNSSAGNFLATTNLTAEKDTEGNVAASYTAVAADWYGSTDSSMNNRLVFGTADQYYEATGCEMGEETQYIYFDAFPFSFAGLTVLEGATGYTLDVAASGGSTSSSRYIYLYGTVYTESDSEDTEDDSTVIEENNSRALFEIYEDFTMTNASTSTEAGYIFLEADVDIYIAADKTFTLTSWVFTSDAAATVYLTGEGTLYLDPTGLSDSIVSYTDINWDLGGTVTLDVSAETTTERIAAVLGTGSVILNGGTLHLSASATITSTLVLTENGGSITTENSQLTLAGGICLSEGDTILDLTRLSVTLAEGFSVVL